MNRWATFLFIFCLITIGSTVTLTAKEVSLNWNWGRAEAVARLSKVDPQYFLCMPCQDFIWFDQDRNRENFREYGLYLQSGYYHLDLKGTKGTLITLFGAESFNLNEGFLVIQKEDDAIVTIDNLENFPVNQWHKVEPQGDTNGSYRVFYQPALNFKENIASIRWGVWWDELPSSDLKMP